MINGIIWYKTSGVFKRVKMNTSRKEIIDENPLDFIDKFMGDFKVPMDLDLPRYSGGLAGYFGYETIKYIEPKLCKEFLEDELNLPDILLIFSLFS